MNKEINKDEFCTRKDKNIVLPVLLKKFTMDYATIKISFKINSKKFWLFGPYEMYIEISHSFYYLPLIVKIHICKVLLMVYWMNKVYEHFNPL